MQSKQEFHLPIDRDGLRAVDYLAETTDFSKQKLKHFMQLGCVWLERVNHDQSQSEVNNTKNQKAYIQRLRRAKKVLNKGEVLHFYYDETVLASQTEKAILIKDYIDYSIWNKPSGMLSQGSKWGDHCTVYRWAEKNLVPERTAFIVHRLDRAANGLIILAHKKKVASKFARMFEQHEIEKKYLVTVEGNFTESLANAEALLTINDDIDSKAATSHARLLAFDEEKQRSHLEVQIDTGRKHQIRKHLAGIGFPVVGDRLYGNHQIITDTENIDLQLRAHSLAFICPITENKRFIRLDSK